jgi:hypothetical protein
MAAMHALWVRLMLALAVMAAVVAVVIVASMSLALARPAVKSGELPPECVHWRVFNNGGAGPLVRWLVCGTGSGGESPARDDTNWQTIIVDGDALRPVHGCGSSWTNPCVLLWPASPQGTKAGS